MEPVTNFLKRSKNMKSTVFALIFGGLSLVEVAHGRTSYLEIETPIRDERGNVALANRDEARQHCESLNKRLPTFQEFVDYAVSRGAKGLVDTDNGTMFSNKFVTVNATYIFEATGYIKNQTTPDDVRSTYWIEDNADPTFYKVKVKDKSGKEYYRYDSFLFNRVNDIGLFFIEQSLNKRNFVCVSKS
jgi:hypothetical protein